MLRILLLLTVGISLGMAQPFKLQVVDKLDLGQTEADRFVHTIAEPRPGAEHDYVLLDEKTGRTWILGLDLRADLSKDSSVSTFSTGLMWREIHRAQSLISFRKVPEKKKTPQ